MRKDLLNDPQKFGWECEWNFLGDEEKTFLGLTSAVYEKRFERWMQKQGKMKRERNEWKNVDEKVRWMERKLLDFKTERKKKSPESQGGETCDKKWLFDSSLPRNGIRHTFIDV